MTYTYIGDRATRSELRGMQCDPVRRADGKCVRGGANMAVIDAAGRLHIVVARRLRRNDKSAKKK